MIVPLQVQLNYRFSRTMKEHLIYSALPKMAPPSAVQLTKQQTQEMRDWRMTYGQGDPEKTVRNMSTKDNPGTLPINL